jgi:glycine/D-amino acid oxidase-like deaminating enzyme
MQVSIWEKESFYAPKDVIIIGSGLAGLWCAYYLKKKKPGLSICIADRGIIPTGASTRNAGFACFGSLTELIHDIDQNGADKMLSLVEMRYRGLQRIQKVFGKKQIDFDLCGGYELFAEDDKLDESLLEEKMVGLNKLLRPVVDEKNTFKFSGKKIRKFGFDHVTHMVENKAEGYLHSGKLCLALLKEVQSQGVTVLSATEVTNFEKTGEQITCYTNQHITLKAGKVIVCTNAFARQLLPQLDIVPARGQVLVTAPIKNLPFKGTFHYQEGFYYFRNLGNRILLGGARNMAFEEETTTEMMTTEKIQSQLEHFLSHYLIPGIAWQITDRWSGIMGMGSEKMPIVREVSPQIFCAVRMSGMGVALTPVIGETMADMILQK